MSEEKKTKLRMNLAAIQNVDPYAKEIIDSSSHVAYYKFKANEWEKSDIEGKSGKKGRDENVARMRKFHKIV